MNKEFIPYEQALQLKELGFDEECLGYYHTTLSSSDVDLVLGKTHNRFYYLVGIPEDFNTLAPLYQQAFRWFREKYFLDAEIYLNHELGHKFYHYLILQLVRENIEWKSRNITKFKTYEEAELACLKKLIEIVKNK
jgi:hypothetical protein